LDYSRAGRTTESKEDVDLNIILSEFKQLRKKIISEKAVSISATELPIIYSYKAIITQVLHSLLDNAIKYSKEKVAPYIEIAASENDDEWKFSIKDNGIGIDSEFFDKIFIIFQRLHNRNEFEGTGIGLSIAKKQVEFLGGKIWVESTPGEGSTFYFTLPKKH
jgi:light-regulated signal transduction histidine kinase (bacteriophytochrome)